jgi:hypothetical protein
VEELRALLNRDGFPEFEAAAPSGAGVMDTLKGVSKLVLRQLRGSSGGPASAIPSSAAPATV